MNPEHKFPYFSAEQEIWAKAIWSVDSYSAMTYYFEQNPDKWIAATLANPTPGGVLKQIIVEAIRLRMIGATG